MRVVTSLYILLILSSCNKEKPDYSVIKISNYESPFTAPIYLAEQLGYYREAGLVLDYRTYQTCSTALSDLTKVKLDIALSMDFPITKALLKSYTIELISYLAHHIREEKYITKNEIALENATVGVTLNTNSKYALDNYLRSQGLSITTINLLDLKPHEMLQAFYSGRINSLVTHESYDHIDNQLDLTTTVLANIMNIICISTNKEYSSKHSDKVKNFLKATNQGIRDLYSQREVDFAVLETEHALYREIIEPFHFGIGLDNHLKHTILIQAKWISRSSTNEILKNINADYLRGIDEIYVTFTE